MGLIKAGLGALNSTLADQWKEFFYCDSLDKETLMVKGQKQISSRSSNTKGNDNIISNGSGIAVADGQCMIIVEQGKIVEVCAEPGEYTYDKSTEPSIFSGKLGDSIKASFATLGKRFTLGGDTGKDQRVYYFNTKEILDNKFGTQNPIPFRVVDNNIGLDTDMGIRCNGTFSYKISDPLLFYTNVCGNVSERYERSEIDGQLKSEFLSALQPAFGKISELCIRYSALPAHTEEICTAMNEVLINKWRNTRGIEVHSIALNSATLSQEDEAEIKELQKKAAYSSSKLGTGAYMEASTQAMKDAANNSGGAMMGFMGMNMAQGYAANNSANIMSVNQQYNQSVQQQAAPAANSWKCACGATATGKFCPECGSKKPEPVQANSWKCACGATATGNFCPECGAKKPAAEEGWTCTCGAVNKGKFCQNCGAKKPEGAPLYKCDKCGWEPEDPHNPPKFCPECGDIFDDKDIK